MNLLNTSSEYRSLSQEFVLKYQEIEKQDPSLSSEEVFEETVKVMRAKGALPMGRRERSVETESGKTLRGSKSSGLDISKLMEE